MRGIVLDESCNFVDKYAHSKRYRPSPATLDHLATEPPTIDDATGHYLGAQKLSTDLVSKLQKNTYDAL